ncbi:MAG: hypothetical protein NZ903_01920 [Candidatus Micrarchaeota archaeon]|nr:hypothetical protein [Candidatus Micrarchaeota archaeon]
MRKRHGMPKINKEKEITRFFEMMNEFDRIEEIRKTMDKMIYLLPSERERIENILFDIHIRTIKNAEWQRKIIDFPKSFIGNVDELINQTEELRKRVISKIKEKKYEKG